MFLLRGREREGENRKKWKLLERRGKNVYGTFLIIIIFVIIIFI